MDSVCEQCKAKKVWKGSMASGRMECPNGCSAYLKDLDDGPNYEQEYPQDGAAPIQPAGGTVGGTQHRIDTLNIPTLAKNMLVNMWNMMQPWQTSGLPIGLWRITKDPRVCPQALCMNCLRAYDWLSHPHSFDIQKSECPSCFGAVMNAKQAARPIQPPPAPPQSKGTLTGRTGGNAPSAVMKKGMRYDQNRMAFVALCRGCGTEYIVHDTSQYDPDMSYCGRTPRCQP